MGKEEAVACCVATTCALAMAARQFQAKNQPIDATAEVERSFDSQDATVHVLICALDYKGTSCPLTCTMDGNNFQQLCRQCGASDVEVLYDNQATKENVVRKVKEMSNRVRGDDYFIFYYSGHGSQSPDINGEEEDGQDETLCFVGPNGELEADYFMTDDEFAELLTESFEEDVRIITICDCCHSGSISDMGDESWQGRDACSLSGCQDNQTSGDMGKGGIFTHSLLLALDDLVNNGTDAEDMTCALVYNTTLHEDDKVFNSAQDIAIATPKTTRPNAIPWPLIPPAGYKAPLRQATSQMAAMAPAGTGGDGQQLAGMLGNPQVSGLLQQLGLSPQVVATMNQNPSGFNALEEQQNGNVEDFMGKLPQVAGFLSSSCGGKQYRSGQVQQYLTGSRLQDCVVQ